MKLPPIERSFDPNNLKDRQKVTQETPVGTKIKCSYDYTGDIYSIKEHRYSEKHGHYVLCINTQCKSYHNFIAKECKVVG